MDSEGGGGLGPGADLTVPERKRAKESNKSEFPRRGCCCGSEIPRRTDYLKFDETRRTGLAKMPALGRGRAVIGRQATRR